jgi:threonine dehydrogenase-like Zn-dependent dehydrogenase
LSNDLSEEKGLLLGDIFSTGYFCAENAGVNNKGTYVVIGCGPVGLMTILAAKDLGAENLFAVDHSNGDCRWLKIWGQAIKSIGSRCKINDSECY